MSDAPTTLGYRSGDELPLRLREAVEAQAEQVRTVLNTNDRGDWGGKTECQQNLGTLEAFANYLASVNGEDPRMFSLWNLSWCLGHGENYKAGELQADILRRMGTVGPPPPPSSILDELVSVGIDDAIEVIQKKESDSRNEAAEARADVEALQAKLTYQAAIEAELAEARVQLAERTAERDRL